MKDDIMFRNAVEILPKQELSKRLACGRQLRVKFGIDPTNADLHLGHTVPLRMLRNFQKRGHKIVLIIGTATAWIGDPSGRDETRQRLSWDQIDKNTDKYLEHIGRFIDISKTEVNYNQDWFGQMSFIEVMKMVGSVTVQQILQREDFATRMAQAKPINLLETIYPLMQGRDSVEVRADVEIGGTEQLFNLNMGREMQRLAGQNPQVCITLPLLTGTDGQKKMGKSLNNYIAVNEDPFEMFSKIMSIPDGSLRDWFRLLTDWTDEQIQQMCNCEPYYQKVTLAGVLVEEAHGTSAAVNAEQEWMRRFSERGDPDNPEEVYLSPGPIGIVPLLRAVKFADSNNAAKRLITPNSCVSVGPDRKTKITDPNAQVEVADGTIVRAGNRRIVRIRCSTP